MGTRAHCPCGQPLHYRTAEIRAYMARQIRRFGPTVVVETTEGTWLVPRHFLALHTFRPWELQTLAAQHGWTRVDDGAQHACGERVGESEHAASCDGYY